MAESVLRIPAELRYADEIARLKASDLALGRTVPEGWQLSPRAVRSFVIGDPSIDVTRKFYGDDPLVDRAIVTLLGRQALMLVGEPGTAKSMLSELLAAAISGTSNLTVQGTAGTTEDHLRYSWNYALLLAEGPTRKALVTSPVYQGMESGRIVRVEEITRTAPEIQDTLVTLLSEKHLMIPELGADALVAARQGFNLIATANVRDRGVNEMSSALKRRFNFETVKPIQERSFEVELVSRQLHDSLSGLPVAVEAPADVIELLVTAFRELRSGHTESGAPIKRPETVMSTAEAVNVAHAAALESAYFGEGHLGGGEIARALTGIALKDSTEDRARLRYWADNVVRERARTSPLWRDFLNAALASWE